MKASISQAMLTSSGSRVRREGTIDDLGGYVFRDVEPGNGYRVAVAGLATSKPLTVTDAAETPPNSLYSKQELDDGYGYLTTRDGTLLMLLNAGPFHAAITARTNWGLLRNPIPRRSP